MPAELHPNIPKAAKWLSGQGEGTWFVITKEKEFNKIEYRVRRFSPQGKLECDRIFEMLQEGFDIKQKFEVTHISHCATVRVIQKEVIYQLNYIKEYK